MPTQNHLAARGDPGDIPDRRIGIIGAGAAGLSLAHHLAEEGYRRVTVLEATGRVGGKCHTMDFEGRTYELGAGAMTPRYHEVRRLMRRVGMKASPRWSGLYVDTDVGRTSFVPPILGGGGWLRAPGETRRLLRLFRKHPRILEPGFDGIDSRLHASTTDFARREGIEVVAELAAPFFTGFGYGFYPETPAAYFLKYATIGGPVLELLDGGFGDLWRRVAKNIDVRLDARIDSVTRTDDRVCVQTRDERHEFDALALACPLDDALAFLDASATEKALFSRLRYNPYVAVGAITRGMPRARWGFVPGNFRRARVGHPMFIYRRWKDSDLMFFFGHPHEGDIDAFIEGARVAARSLGGRIEKIEIVKPWRYFPHVGTSDFDDGFYEKLEALQGERRTWYTGEALAFGAVEFCVAYSKELVKRCFAMPR